MLSQALRFAGWKEEMRVEERRIRQRVKRLAAGTRPVLVGPWSGEVGFELLYWIPFVTWAVREAGITPDRLVIVSRGGPASWYAHLGGRYVDVLSSVAPEEFRSRTEAEKKQRGVGAFDREILRRVVAASGLERPDVLHPGLMYRLFRPFWQQEATVHRVDDYTRYERVHAAPDGALARRLPSDYVAVRFYFSSSFPDTPDNRSFAESTVRALTASTNVVMLSPGVRVDDHRDFTPGASSRIHLVDDLMTPERNLEIQTAVIAGARAFVGTYGGYAYLAPFCNVPAIAFYSNRNGFHAYHLELADRVFRRLNSASLVALDVRDAALVRASLGAAQDLHA
jgi:hypothetical protein